MATTVVKTIGTTSRDYSTIQAWEDACPANLVTADQIWQGQCYNDSEFTAGVTIAGMNTDATRYVELTAAAGQSFQDHADVRTNPLRYDQTKGVGVLNTSAWSASISISISYCKVNRLQGKATAAYSSAFTIAALLTGVVIKDCILQSVGTPSNWSSTMINCVLVQTTSGNAAIQGGSAAIFIGCTLVKPSDITAGGTGLSMAYGGNIAQSCVIFGFTTAAAGTWDASSGYNATNLASGLPGTTGNVYNVTYNQTTPFTDADKDSLDLRAVAATALAGAGYLDSTNAPNDISKTARAASPTIGAWELTAAASGPANLKTINGLAKASVKTINGLAIASVKTWNGLA